MPQRKCKDCKFWSGVDRKIGFCHRYPPVSNDGDAEDHDTFPVVDDDDWCGEFKAKAEEGLSRITAEDMRKGTCYPVNLYG